MWHQARVWLCHYLPIRERGIVRQKVLKRARLWNHVLKRARLWNQARAQLCRRKTKLAIKSFKLTFGIGSSALHVFYGEPSFTQAELEGHHRMKLSMAKPWGPLQCWEASHKTLSYPALPYPTLPYPTLPWIMPTIREEQNRLGTLTSISGVGVLVLDFRFRVSGFGFRVSDFGFRISGFVFRGSGFGIRVQVFQGLGSSGFRWMTV